MVSVRSLIPVLALCLLVPATVRADVSTGPKVALHVKAVASKSSTICTTWQPKTTPCSQYVNTGDLFQDQLVYLITTDVSADDGVAGVVCGIDYNDMPKEGRVRLAVYDVAGREVRVLRQALEPPGRHETIWDARDAAGRSLGAGVYYLRMEAGDFIGTQRIILVK